MEHDWYNFDDISWEDAVSTLSQIRESDDYSGVNIDMVRYMLKHEDLRVRAAAAITAQGCVFESEIIEILTEIVEYDSEQGVRLAAIQSLGEVIHEGIEQGFEDEHGTDNTLDYAEEWEEYQEGSLKENYQLTRDLLINVLETEESEVILEKTIQSLSDLGNQDLIRDQIAALYDSDLPSARVVALRSMGKFPQFWENEIAESISLETPPEILKEAISAAFSSNSIRVSDALQTVLNTENPEILEFALLSFVNIGLADNIFDICKSFANHPLESVREAAQKGINKMSLQNFDEYFRDELGFDE